MRSVKITLFVLFAISIGIGCATTATTTPSKKKESTVATGFPDGYKDWRNTVAKVELDKTSPFYGYQRVFVSEIAMPTYKYGGQYPEGSRLVLEFNEPTTENSIKGATMWIAVMTKNSTAIETGGWLYKAYLDRKTEKFIDPVKDCYLCHAEMKRKDYIFSSAKLK